MEVTTSTAFSIVCLEAQVEADCVTATLIESRSDDSTFSRSLNETFSLLLSRLLMMARRLLETTWPIESGTGDVREMFSSSFATRFSRPRMDWVNDVTTFDSSDLSTPNFCCWTSIAICCP